MRLLTMREIPGALREHFGKGETAFLGFDVDAPGLTSERIEALHNHLAVRLPPVFTATIQQYDLCRLTAGAVSFGFGEDYAAFLERRNSPVSLSWEQWWGGNSSRPESLLLIGGTDGYVLLLNCDDDSVLAYRRTESWHEAKRVAQDVEQVIRVMGTLLILPGSYGDTAGTLEWIASITDADPESPFWKDVLRGC